MSTLEALPLHPRPGQLIYLLLRILNNCSEIKQRRVKVTSIRRFCCSAGILVQNHQTFSNLVRSMSNGDQPEDHTRGMVDADAQDLGPGISIPHTPDDGINASPSHGPGNPLTNANTQFTHIYQMEIRESRFMSLQYIINRLCSHRARTRQAVLQARILEWQW